MILSFRSRSDIRLDVLPCYNGLDEAEHVVQRSHWHRYLAKFLKPVAEWHVQTKMSEPKAIVTWIAC